MRALLASIVVATACGGAPRPTAAPATAPVATAPTGPIELALYTPTALPGTDVTVTVLDVRAELPREELPQDRGFVEREPAKVALEIAEHGEKTRVEWEPGPHDLGGVHWMLAVRHDVVTLARAD